MQSLKLCFLFGEEIEGNVDRDRYEGRRTPQNVMTTIPTPYVTHKVLRCGMPARRSGNDAHVHVLVLNIYMYIYLALFALTKENNYDSVDLTLFY